MTLTNDGARTIQVVEAPASTGPQWRPVAADEFSALLDSVVPERARRRVEQEAFQILGHCLIPAREPTIRTGLVVGHVQSGKTLSFTAVSALARDNGYQLVILVAGTNNILLGQSRQRLRRDLRLNQPNAYYRWLRLEVDTSVPVAAIRDRLNACLLEWRDARVPPAERATILVTVLKNWQDLSHLSDALEQVEMSGVTALLVDDEADQASLNSQVRKGLESTTYHQLRRLRSVLPRHTLLQYTATPQAPLLISIADSLSPDFCFLLEPGDEYVGGGDVFYPDSAHVRVLSDADAESEGGVAPPNGLIHAIACFLVSAAASRLEQPRPANRSMLIHPSRRIEPHENYRLWITRIRQLWDELLNRPGDDPDREALIAILERAREDIAGTFPEIPSLGNIIPEIQAVLRRCNVEVLNADPRGPGIREIPWSDGYAWILIGGQLLDRGFTVEGLITTYMSRPLGLGTADTLWQRARFLGYRGRYRQHIRIFVDQTTADAFSAYVEHERHMRSQLQDSVVANVPLRDWRRRFLLDRGLKATRAQVLRSLPRRVTFSDSWAVQEFPHEVAERTRRQNWDVIRQFLASIDPQPDERYGGRRHLRGHASLREVLEGLVSRYQFEDENDAMRFSGLECQLSLYLDRTDGREEECLLYEMRAGEQSGRQTRPSGSIDNIFSGRSGSYPGDDRVRGDGVTIQVHRLEIHDQNGRSLGQDLPALAIWVPNRMAADIVVQPEDEG